MNCSLCGRFTERITDAVGLPLSTAFPPDRPMFASSVPYAPFKCSNPKHRHTPFERVEYQPVGFNDE